jgi:hypothetical protein
LLRAQKLGSVEAKDQAALERAAERYAATLDLSPAPYGAGAGEPPVSRRQARPSDRLTAFRICQLIY